MSVLSILPFVLPLLPAVATRALAEGADIERDVVELGRGAGMASNVVDPREHAARALCELRGNRPDALMNGDTVWKSYLDEVDVVLAAVGFETGVISVNDNDAEGQ